MKNLLIIIFLVIANNIFAIETSNFSNEKTNYEITEYYSVNDSCDVIYLNDGNVIEGKVTEINDSEIVYYSCDNLNGPKRVIKKSSAFKINYSNGTYEIISNKKSNKFEKWSIIGFCAGIAGLIIFGIPFGLVAVIGSCYGIVCATKNYSKGVGLGVAGLILGLIDVIGAIIILQNL